MLGQVNCSPEQVYCLPGEPAVEPPVLGVVGTQWALKQEVPVAL